MIKSLLNLIDRTLLVQVLVVVSRPLFYIWSVGEVGSYPWLADFLVGFGFIAAFSILDVLFVAVARHRFISRGGTADGKGLSRLLGSAVVFSCLLIFLVGIASKNSTLLLCSIFTLYSVSSISNVYELGNAVPEAVFFQAILEAGGYLWLYLLGLLWHAPGLAIALLLIFPISRIVTACRYRSVSEYVPSVIHSGLSRTSFIGLSVLAQVFASLAGSLPSLFVLVDLTSKEQIADSLIYFKVMFATSALLSTGVNLIGSRLFYGIVRIEFGSSVRLLRLVDAVVVGFSIVFAIILFFDVFNLKLGLVWNFIYFTFCFSYLNLISSLALTKGRPDLSAVSQVFILFGSISIALSLGDFYYYSALFAFLFVLIYLLLARKFVRLSAVIV